mmetsp:Transcript_32624/g.73096  ORF Transcript_32624/g.73096 Transcript_32624/m.73096 type:complete len:89 (+) Transcript_32624:124-390(+)
MAANNRCSALQAGVHAPALIHGVATVDRQRAQRADGHDNCNPTGTQNATPAHQCCGAGTKKQSPSAYASARVCWQLPAASLCVIPRWL